MTIYTLWEVVQLDQFYKTSFFFKLGVQYMHDMTISNYWRGEVYVN